MRTTIMAAVTTLAIGLGGCATGGYGYGGGYGGAPQTQLSQCMRNALVGAGVGAVIGGVTAPDGNRTENAAIGAVVGGAGTYGVCRYLDNRSQARIEQSYYRALDTGAPVNDSWAAQSGESRQVYVSSPQPAPGYSSDCRRVTATISGTGQGRQDLPPETFCRNATGGWVPVA
jgi:surface antigen